MPDSDSLITLRAGRACAGVVPHIGGSLAHYHWLDGARRHDWLRPPAAADLTAGTADRMACFPLVPFSNRVRDGRFSFGGHAVSMICGAGWAATMRRVMVPLAAPAILAGAILVFSTLIGEISATVLLYSAKWKTISIAIYELVLGDQLAQASAIGTITTVMTLLLVLAASRLAGKNMAELFR
jgi:ABC-type spermidine/putrescine transport system permease subunit II